MNLLFKHQKKRKLIFFLNVIFILIFFDLAYSINDQSLINHISFPKSINSGYLDAINDFGYSDYSDVDNLDPFGTRFRTVGTRKDAFFAGLISVFMPGTGQIYAEKYSKGIIFASVDLLSKISLFTLITVITDKYTSENRDNDYLNWSKIRGSDRTILFSSVILYICFVGYNVFDAVESVDEYNSLYFEEFPMSINSDRKLENINIGFNFMY